MSFTSHISHLIEAEFLSHRGLPNAPDGCYEPAQEDPGIFLNAMNRIHHDIDTGIRIDQNPKAIRAFIHAAQATIHHSGVNDREHAFEDGLDILSNMNSDSPFLRRMNNLVISSRKRVFVRARKL